MNCSDQARGLGFPVSGYLIARAFVALSLVCAMGGVFGQGATFVRLPEFEAWIAEAEKGNKDPVDWALEKGRGEDWASRLDAYLVKRKLAPIQARIAQKEAEAKEREFRIAQKEAQSLRLPRVSSPP